MKSNHISTAKLLGGLFFLNLVLSLSVWLWTRPNGVGEYDASPDGRWTAHVSNLSRGTLTGSRYTYLEIRVVESATGLILTRRELPYGPNDRVPDYSDRSQRFITWATNSNQFTVAITNGASVAIAVSTKT